MGVVDAPSAASTVSGLEPAVSPEKPAGSGGGDKSRALRVVGLTLSAGVVVIVAAFSLGLIPGAQLVHLSNWAVVEGYADCALDQGDLLVRYCDAVGFPAGGLAFENMVGKTLALWLSRLLGVGAFTAFQGLGIAFLVLAVAGFVGLSRMFTGRSWPGILAASLYLLSPAVGASPGLPQTGFGSFLLVFFLWAGLRLGLWAGGRVSRLTVMGGYVFLSGLILVNVWGYAFLFYVVLLGGSLAVMALCEGLRQRRWSLLGPTVTTMAATLAVAVVQLRFWPRVATAAVDIDFIRGTSVDLLGVLLPGPANPLWRWLGLTTTELGLSSRLFIGGAPFLGYFAVALFILGWLAMRKAGDEGGKASRRSLGSALLAGAVVVTVLMLGPSLRVNDPWPAEDQPLSFSATKMPSEEAVFDFPWSPIFEAPGFSLARVVWRWQIPLRLLLSLGAAAGLASLVHRKPANLGVWVLAAILTGGVLAEGVRDDLFKRGAGYWGHQAVVARFTDDVVRPLDSVIPDGSTVLYLPSANDYLAPALGPLIDVTTVNVNGDKNRLLARESYPEEVSAVMRSYGSENFDPEAVAELISSSTVDYVVLDFFSLRQASYEWPPSGGDLERLRSTAEEVAAGLAGRCQIVEVDYAIVVGPCSGG